MPELLEISPAPPNSRQGYPTLTNGVEELHAEPQFEGHVFLTGHTVNPRLLREAISYTPVEGDEAVGSFAHNVCKLDDKWYVPQYFSRYAGYCATLLGAAMESPKSGGIEAYNFAVDQFPPEHSSSVRRGIGWHHDYPFSEYGWQVAVANRGTTQIALTETKSDRVGVRVSKGTPVWRPKAGEVILIDRYTAHRRPRIHSATTCRTFASLGPVLGKTRLLEATTELLERADYGDFDQVQIGQLERASSSDVPDANRIWLD